jgi:DnaJ domain
MNNAWHFEDNPYSTADLFRAQEPEADQLGDASPSCVASQIRELLGEDFELDASILEESWMSGLPVASTRYPRNRERATKDDNGVTFAELGTVGSLFFAQENGLMGDRPAKAYPDRPTLPYTAAWLTNPLEELGSWKENQAAERDSADNARRASDTGVLGLMTYQRACELLGVSGGSSITQIRAAYRRMVGEWHPDRLEQSGERMRAFATKQMAAINEAYHLLRDFSAVPAC